MTAVFLKLAEAREVMGHRFGWEVAGCGAFIAAVLITLGANAAFGVTGALVFDGSPTGLHPSGFDPTFAGED